MESGNYGIIGTTTISSSRLVRERELLWALSSFCTCHHVLYGLALLPSYGGVEGMSY
jgi:hypothetical protein